MNTSVDIPVELLREILDYLTAQPWKQVHRLLTKIQAHYLDSGLFVDGAPGTARETIDMTPTVKGFPA